MAHCKICGEEIEDGQDLCEKCQADTEGVDLDQIDVDVDGLEDLDLSLEDLELPELAGDMLETNLEFELDDPGNNLENPDIFVHGMETEENAVSDATGDVEETIPEADKVVAAEADTEAEPEMEESALEPDMAASVTEDIPDLPVDLDGLETEENSSTGDVDADLSSLLPEDTPSQEDPLMDLDGLLPEGDMNDIGLDGLGLDELQSEPAEEAVAAEDAGAMDDDPLAGMPDSIMNLFPDDSVDGGTANDTADVDLMSGASDVSAEPDLDILGAVPDAEAMAEIAEPKKKISIWKRLFGNIKDEKWEKQKEKEEKAEADRLAKAEAKKAKEAEEASQTEEGQEGEEKIDPKEAKKAEKLAKKEEKARLKAEKKAEKQRLKELAELEDQDEGRINRVGAAIVFVFFGLAAATVIAGTNIFSYNSSIKRAQDYFSEDEYNAAYDAINGLQVKEKDSALYDQIRTVMYVNKEWNSYQNYTGIRMYPEALDSLIKGLEKYDKHIDEAKDMDITEDMDKVRARIVDELQKSYELSEKEAYQLLNIKNQEDYSKEVIKIANQ